MNTMHQVQLGKLEKILSLVAQFFYIYYIFIFSSVATTHRSTITKFTSIWCTSIIIKGIGHGT